VSRDYELGFILNPEVSEDEIRALLGRIEQIVANYGGQIIKVNQWGRRRLAYPIERHRDGYYIFIDSILTPETVAEIERTLRVSEIVFRHMMKRRDSKAVQKEREEREARAASAAAQAEAASQAEASATPVEAEGQTEAPIEAQTEAPIEAQTEAPIEAQTETEEVAATPVAEEAVVLSPEEIDSAPPAIEENSEAVKA
jgi:small subunit ribosomal protein S6